MNLNVLEGWQRNSHSTDPDRVLRANQLRAFYETMSTQLFKQYEPTKISSARISREFLIKIESWLEGFSNDEDKWQAFRSIEYLFFAGQAEFEELYRCGVNHNLVPWIIDQSGIDLFSHEVDELVREEISKCWVCPATDSLRINGFLHVTGLEGQSLRPDWLSLKQFADVNKVQEYIKAKNIKYLVLVEDFVGSSRQFSRVLNFAASVFSGPIFLMPLIICAPGERKLCKDIKALNRSNICYKPGLVIEDSCLVGQNPTSNEPKLFNALRQVMKTGYKKMDCELDGEEYGWEKVGSLVVLYSNCPNNTPPIYHHNVSTWNPLFPRIVREQKVPK